MKLLNLDHSPYATRVRIQLRKKNLPIAIQTPDVALRTSEFSDRYPLGKVPVLILDNGDSLGESTVIMDYLEDTQPADTSLRPDSAWARAQMHLLTRYADTHLGPGALFPVFKQLMNPGEKDMASLLPLLHAELAKGDRLLATQPPLDMRDLHLGDIALVTTLAYVVLLAPALGEVDILDDYPHLQAWWQWVMSDSAVSQSINELSEAFKAFSSRVN